MANEVSKTRDGYVVCARCGSRRPKGATLWLRPEVEGEPGTRICSEVDYCNATRQQYHTAAPKQEQPK